MESRKLLLLLALGVPLVGCEMEDESSDVEQQREPILGGTATNSWSGVGRLPGCTGTLITNTTVLTAAHCVCSTSPFVDIATSCSTTSSITFDAIGTSKPGSVTVHPEFSLDGVWYANDYATIELDDPVSTYTSSVAPTYLDPGSSAPSVGASHQIVGYSNNASCGATTTTAKRKGSITLDQYNVRTPTG
ncbi:MAG: S1 family peptidase, partial [Myxococcales bacterium]|nr:S1 family peptidase [Myxococcales bacterium]